MTGRPEVVGIVMAAGGSTQFGSPKQLLPYGNTTLLGHVVSLVNASTLEQIVVVLGREAEQVRGSVDWGRAAVVDNLAYGTGCASSLLAGMDTAGDCAAINLCVLPLWPEGMRAAATPTEWAFYLPTPCQSTIVSGSGERSLGEYTVATQSPLTMSS